MASLILGFVISKVYMFKSSYTKNFVITIMLLPILVQSVIFVVNGNLGAGVAVMGAFSLVRFRSVPGSSKEIISIFFAMAVGLICGMGYITYAVFLTATVCIILLILNKSSYGETTELTKFLRITVPEDLDYTTAFNDLFDRYTYDSTLQKVRTTQLGSLYELQYSIILKNPEQEKEFIDNMRKRNGNLSIVCSIPLTAKEDL